MYHTDLKYEAVAKHSLLSIVACDSLNLMTYVFVTLCPDLIKNITTFIMETSILIEYMFKATKFDNLSHFYFEICVRSEILNKSYIEIRQNSKHW